MAKPVSVTWTFNTLSGNIPLSYLDTNYSNILTQLNDTLTYSNYLVDTGSANSYVVAFGVGLTTSYTAGLLLVFRAANANTGASTLNVNGLGARNIINGNGAALVANQIGANSLVLVCYDGTAFRMLNDPSGGTVTAGNLAVTGNLTVNGTSTFTGAATFTANPTLSGGTANGVAYLNASKVVTTGSALVFDGTNLGIGTASPAAYGGYTTLAINNATNGGLIDLLTNGTRVFTMYAGSTSVLGTVNTSNLAFHTVNTERMRLDTSGNLGIGTASPGARLHVVGSQYRQNDATNSFGFVINTASGTTRLETLFGGSAFGIRTGGGTTDFINVDGSGNTTVGAGTLATTATDGFLYVPTCAGTPTGTPTAKTGFAPIVVNTTNNKLFFYSGGAWRDAGP